MGKSRGQSAAKAVKRERLGAWTEREIAVTVRPDSERTVCDSKPDRSATVTPVQLTKGRTAQDMLDFLRADRARRDGTSD